MERGEKVKFILIACLIRDIAAACMALLVTASISFNIGGPSQVNETTNEPIDTVTTTPGTN